MNRRRFIAGAAALIATPAAALIATPAAFAQPPGFLDEHDEWLADEYGYMWPSKATLKADFVNGVYKASMDFTFDDDRLYALQCTGSDVKASFMLGGFSPSRRRARENSWVTSDLPGSDTKSVSVNEDDSEVTFTYGATYTDEIESGVEYTASIEAWDLTPVQGLYQWVSMRLVVDGVTIFITRGVLDDVIHFDRGEQTFKYTAP